MKTTVHIDAALLQEAKTAAGATTTTEAIRLGLEALVRRAAAARLAALAGSEPHAKPVPRRRPA